MVSERHCGIIEDLVSSSIDGPTVDFRICRAIVTGASSGIGRAIAIELVRDGANLVMAAAMSDCAREELATELASQAVEPCWSSAMSLVRGSRRGDGMGREKLAASMPGEQRRPRSDGPLCRFVSRAAA